MKRLDMISNKWKSVVVVAALAVACLASPSQARPGKGGPFGLGIIIGEPTGISGKLFTTQTTAFQGAAAWSVGGVDAFHLQIDYVLHRYDVIDVSEGQLPLYFGIGGRVLIRDDRDDHIGLRIPVGLSYEFSNAPFDIFGELVPLLDLTPDTDFDIEGGLGARFYF